MTTSIAIVAQGSPTTKNGVNPEGCTPPQHNNHYAAKWEVWEVKNVGCAIFLAMSAIASWCHDLAVW
ncbi:hypothetical protein MSKU3_3189 [Komagataeibacter oboediens]|nr:hypothetical protein MSKU3_3189 [Komagataeibacter oboediens]